MMGTKRRASRDMARMDGKHFSLDSVLTVLSFLILVVVVVIPMVMIVYNTFFYEGKFDTSLYILYDFRSCTRFADFFHCHLEFQTVFGLFDRLRSSTDQTYVVSFKESILIQLHSQIQCCLSTQCRKDTVWFFL